MEGPAWTREPKKKGKKPARTIVSSAPAAGQQQTPFYSASGSNSASSSSLLHLPSTSAPQQEAPYLTHAVRNPLGQITLVPPDNLGRQRQRGEGDAASFASDEQQAPVKVKKKRKKKPDPAILDAVINVGRISPAALPEAGGPEGGRSSRSAEDRGLSPAGRAVAQDMGRSRSAQQVERNRLAAAEAAQTRQDSATRATLDAAAAPAYAQPAPSTFTTVAEQLDSHHTLAPAALEESPPPAYPARSRSSSPQPPLLDLSSPNPRLEASPVQPDLPLHIPPSPPNISQLAISPDETFVYNDQDPFVLAWEEDRAAGLPLDVRIERDLARRSAAAAQGVPVEEESPSSDEETADVATPTHAAARDLGVEGVSRSYASTSTSSLSAPPSPPPSSSADMPSAPQPNWRPAPESEDVVASWQRREIAAAEASQDAPRVARALSVYAGRRFAEAAERRIARAQRRREGGMSSTTASSVVGEEEEEEEPTTPRQAQRIDSAASRELSPPITLNPQSAAAAPLTVARPPSPTASLSHTTAQSTALEPVSAEEKDKEEAAEEEEEEEEEEETTARPVPVEAHRRFAEAAERRIAAERAAREREREAQLKAQQSATVEPANQDRAGDETAKEGNERSGGDTDEEHMPSSPYALLFPSSAKAFGSPTKPPASAASPAPSTSSSTQPLPPSAASPSPHEVAQSPSPPPASTLATQASPQPSPPAPLVPSTAFADLANAFSSGPDTLGLAASLRPFPRPRAPTINELLAESPTRSMAESSSTPTRVSSLPPPPVPIQAQRRPPPMPPARPSSLYNRDLPPPPPSSSAPLLTHIPTGDQSSLARPLQPATTRPPPPPVPPTRPLSLHRRPAPPPPPPTRVAMASQQSLPAEAVPDPNSPTPPPPPTQPQNRRRPLPVPPSPPPNSASGSNPVPRIDAYTALRARVEAFNVARERERALARLEGSEEGMLRPSTSEASLQPASEGGLRVMERPRSATSSFEVPDEGGDPMQGDSRGTTGGQAQEFNAYTDLDLLLARLEGDAQEGTNYDDLNILGEVLGPAQAVGASDLELETLAVARVELERRRVDKHGKVKLKLSVVGVRCIDCSICLTRFKVDDLAVVLPACLHAFHETCIRSWLGRSRQCPLCRVDVFPPRNIDI